MKKAVILFFAAAAIFVQSCKQETSTQQAGNGKNDVSALLPGKWYEYENDLTLSLNPDGTYNEVFMGQESQRGKYKLTGDSIYFDIDDDGADGYYKPIVSIDDKQLVLGTEDSKQVLERK